MFLCAGLCEVEKDMGVWAAEEKSMTSPNYLEELSSASPVGIESSLAYNVQPGGGLLHDAKI